MGTLRLDKGKEWTVKVGRTAVAPQQAKCKQRKAFKQHSACPAICSRWTQAAPPAQPPCPPVEAAPHRTPSGAVAHSRCVVYLEELKPPSTGCTFFTALRGAEEGRGVGYASGHGHRSREHGTGYPMADGSCATPVCTCCNLAKHAAP